MAVVELQLSISQQRAWYAIYAKHQHEKKAADLLARKGFEILLPIYPSVRRWTDRKRTVFLPLFPCYLFVRTDLLRKIDILRTSGVFRLVESGGCACPIPEGDIEAIKRIIHSEAQVAPHPFLKSGERVRVKHGSLKGVEGILTRFKNQHRVVITVEPLQKAYAVEVDILDVEPLHCNEPRAIPPTFHSAAAGRSEACCAEPTNEGRTPLSRDSRAAMVCTSEGRQRCSAPIQPSLEAKPAFVRPMRGGAAR